MGHTLSLAETARIEELLSRLDPDDHGPCQVAGCIHAAHADLTVPEDLPALAA